MFIVWCLERDLNLVKLYCIIYINVLNIGLGGLEGGLYDFYLWWVIYIMFLVGVGFN